MAATGIVALFSGLSAASSGAHGSVNGLLNMLSAMRCVFFFLNLSSVLRMTFRFLLGIGVGAEYPCGSVSASEQSEEPGISKRAQHRWFALATSEHTAYLWLYSCLNKDMTTDTMIDFGFVVSAFVPLVLYWMCVFHIKKAGRQANPRCSADLEIIIFVRYGVSPSVLVLFLLWECLFGVSTCKNQLVSKRIP